MTKSCTVLWLFVIFLCNGFIYKIQSLWIVTIAIVYFTEISMNCFGHSGVLNGQNRLPTPPAMITM
jgi:hypothetical protein